MQILLIEHCDTIARWLQATLQAAGHSVALCRDGAAANAWLTGQRPELVVLEATLPDATSAALLVGLRARGLTVPAVVLHPANSGASSSDPQVVTLERPFSRQQLLAAVIRLRDGQPAPAPAAADGLPAGLPEALAALAQRGLTGKLNVRSGELHRRVTLRNGVPSYVWGDYSSDNFGRFLVRQNVITEAVLERSHAVMIAKGVPQGEALIEIGALQSMHLFALLRSFQRERMLAMFSWPEPTLEWVDEEPLPGEPVYAIDPQSLIFEGYQRHGAVAELFHWPEEFGHLYAVRTPRFDELYPLLQSQWPRLPLAELTAGTEALHMVLRAVPVDAMFAVRTLKAMLALGMIALRDSAGPAVAAPVLDPGAVLSEYGLDRGRADLEVDLGRRASPEVDALFDTYLSMQFSSYYDFFGVAADAEVAAVDAAYQQRRQQYLQLLIGLAELPDAHERVLELLGHLQRGHALLRDPEVRAAYDEKMRERVRASVERRVSLGAEARFKSGLTALQEGRHQMARIEFEAARALRKGDAQCTVYANWAAYLEMRSQAARIGALQQQLGEAAQLVGDAAGLVFHARICLDLGFPEQARQAATSALQIDAKHAEAREILTQLDASATAAAGAPASAS